MSTYKTFSSVKSKVSCFYDPSIRVGKRILCVMSKTTRIASLTRSLNIKENESRKVAGKLVGEINRESNNHVGKN